MHFYGVTTLGIVIRDAASGGGHEDIIARSLRLFFTQLGCPSTEMASGQDCHRNGTVEWRWSRRAKLTVNGPVKYAVKKCNLFVVDEDGKEHEIEIVKKTLKAPQPN